MRFALLIVEPPGQRAERTEAEGREAYARMQHFGEALRERGMLVAVQSLAAQSRAVRVSRAGAMVVDGPFAEAKEMVGGFFLVECSGLAEALALARECPAAASGRRSRCGRRRLVSRTASADDPRVSTDPRVVDSASRRSS